MMEVAASTSGLTYSPYAPANLANGRGRADAGESTASGQKALDDQEQKQVADLKRRDREVRAHESAHMAAGSGLVRGGASFEYERGPDGKNYAVGGEVSIDSSAVAGDPEATLAKAQKIRAAALAPADPSGQDRRVAAQATQMAAEARMEMAKERQQGDSDSDSAAGAQALSNAEKMGRYSAIESGQEPRKALLDLFL